MDTLDIVIIILSIVIIFLLCVACYNENTMKMQEKTIKKLTSIRPLHFDENVPMRIYNPQEKEESPIDMNNIIE